MAISTSSTTKSKEFNPNYVVVNGFILDYTHDPEMGQLHKSMLSDFRKGKYTGKLNFTAYKTWRELQRQKHEAHVKFHMVKKETKETKEIESPEVIPTYELEAHKVEEFLSHCKKKGWVKEYPSISPSETPTPEPKEDKPMETPTEYPKWEGEEEETVFNDEDIIELYHAEKRKEGQLGHYRDLLKKEDEVQYITQTGLMVPTLITNFRFPTEGICIQNHKADLMTHLTKRESLLVHMDNLPEEIKSEIDYPENGQDDWLAYSQSKTALQQLIQTKLQEELDKGLEYNHGDVIFSYEELGIELVNKKFNQPLYLKSWKFVPAAFKDDAVEVQLQLSLLSWEQRAKLRGNAIKGVVYLDKSMNIKVFDAQGNQITNWVTLHPGASLKGQVPVIAAFANRIGKCKLNIVEGTVTPITGPMAGKSFDISKRNNVIDKWRNAATQDCIVEMNMARAEWDFIYQVDQSKGHTIGDNDYDVLEVFELDENTVLLRVKVQVLQTMLPYNVEVSLPEESSGKTALTPEMISVMKLQNRLVGERMESLGNEQRETLLEMANMFVNEIPSREEGEGPDVLKLQDSTSLLALKEKLGNTDISVSDQDLLHKFSRLYPKGLDIQSEGAKDKIFSQYFNFKTIASIATFISGSGKDVTADIIHFLRWLPTQAGVSGADSKLHGAFTLLCSGMNGWIQSQVSSRSLRKKLVAGRKGTAFGSKVITAALPELNHKGKVPNCIPKVAINPNNELLREIAKSPMTGKIDRQYLVERQLDEYGKAELYMVQRIEEDDVKEFTATPKQVDKGLNDNEEVIAKLVFNPYLLQGEFVSVFRTPMPMQGGCELVLSDNVANGYIAILMHVWAAINEGDSDGDGIGLVPLFHYFNEARLSRKQRLEAILYMNNHIMGMGGYVLCYGSNPADWPCSEFFDYEASVTKKALRVDEKTYKILEKKGILPHIRQKPLVEWFGATEDVPKHYRMVVGITYNIAVIAINESLDLQYVIWTLEKIKAEKGSLPEKFEKQLKVAKVNLDLNLKACAIAWRLLYEGLGLAGFSPEATIWISLFNICPWGDAWTWGPDGKPSLTKDDTPKELSFSFSLMKYLGNYEGNRDGKGQWSGGFSHLTEADAICRQIIRYSNIKADWSTLENPSSDGKKIRYAAILGNKSRFNKAVLRRSQRLLSQGVDWVMVDVLQDELNDDGGDDYYSIDPSEDVKGLSLLKEAVEHDVFRLVKDTNLAAILRQAATFQCETVSHLVHLEDLEDSSSEDSYH